MGVCFDHALCDMGGAAVLLSHVSQHYASLDASPEPPCADRSKQALVVLEDEEEERESQDVQDGAKTRTGAALGTVSKLKGGCACVEWRYGSGVLAALKRSHAAHSRHDAVFAEALAVLREAGAPLATASIARDDRARGENVLPPQHFGNGSVLVEAQLLPPTEQSPTTPPTLLVRAFSQQRPRKLKKRLSRDHTFLREVVGKRERERWLGGFSWGVVSRASPQTSALGSSGDTEQSASTRSHDHTSRVFTSNENLPHRHRRCARRCRGAAASWRSSATATRTRTSSPGGTPSSATSASGRATRPRPRWRSVPRPHAIAEPLLPNQSVFSDTRACCCCWGNNSECLSCFRARASVVDALVERVHRNLRKCAHFWACEKQTRLPPPLRPVQSDPRAHASSFPPNFCSFLLSLTRTLRDAGGDRGETLRELPSPSST